MKNRNKKIDAWRLVFCIMIVVYHSNKFIGDGLYFAKGWYIGIEFFSIVSGVFLMSSIDRISDVSCIFLKKVKNVYPLYIISYFLAFFITQIARHTGWKESIKTLFHSIGRMFLSEMTGIDIFRGYSLQGSWYVSAMILASLIILCIYTISGKWFHQVVAPFLVILFIGYFNQTYGRIHKTHDWTLFIYSGTIRVTAEMLLGCICYKAGQELKKIDKKYKDMLCALEIVSYMTVVIASYFYSRSSYDFIYLILLAIAVTLSLGIEAKDYNILDKISWIGKIFSFPVYLNHLWLLYIIKELDFHMEWKVLLFVLSLLASCLVVMLIDNIFRIAVQKYIIYRNRLLLEEREKEFT